MGYVSDAPFPRDRSSDLRRIRVRTRIVSRPMGIAPVGPGVDLAILGCAIALRQHGRECAQVPPDLQKIRIRNLLPLRFEWGLELDPKRFKLFLIHMALLSHVTDDIGRHRVTALSYRLDTTPALVRDSSSEPHTGGNQWALRRRSGGDWRIRRTGTRERVLCERWDSRRGSVRRPLPYRAQREESMQREQKLAATSGYYGGRFEVPSATGE
jgi:hypothetical protein